MSEQTNRIYVIPPNKSLTIRSGRLQLGEMTAGRSQPIAIDGFFRSLAADQRENAVGIILSGTGGHGTPGLKDIKAAGGLSLAQDPATAEFDQMPRNAITTGMVDYILPPEQMPQAMISYFRQNPAVPSTESASATDEEMG